MAFASQQRWTPPRSNPLSGGGGAAENGPASTALLLLQQRLDRARAEASSSPLPQQQQQQQQQQYAQQRSDLRSANAPSVSSASSSSYAHSATAATAALPNAIAQSSYHRPEHSAASPAPQPQQQPQDQSLSQPQQHQQQPQPQQHQQHQRSSSASSSASAATAASRGGYNSGGGAKQAYGTAGSAHSLQHGRQETERRRPESPRADDSNAMGAAMGERCARSRRERLPGHAAFPLESLAGRHAHIRFHHPPVGSGRHWQRSTSCGRHSLKGTSA